MPLTITVSEPLAGRLKSRADAERLPVDELASRLLEHGVARPLEGEAWRTANSRRVALIEKRFASWLTDEERDELQNLQELADRQLEDLDARLLRDVARMEALVRKTAMSGE